MEVPACGSHRLHYGKKTPELLTIYNFVDAKEIQCSSIDLLMLNIDLHIPTTTYLFLVCVHIMSINCCFLCASCPCQIHLFSFLSTVFHMKTIHPIWHNVYFQQFFPAV